MELTALLKAATWLNSLAPGEAAVVWSDSAYAVDGANRWRHIWKTNGWKRIDPDPKARKRRIADQQLWQDIDLELSRNPFLTVIWCKGHSGIEGNEAADRLADIGRLSLNGSNRT
jgi:ribonuclease HI